MPNFELLAPAGDLERVRTALRFGADAVYLGGPQMQLRAGQVGFSMENLAQAIREAHSVNRRVYVTVNAFAYNRDIDALPDYAQALEFLGADAVIVSDLGAIAAIRKAAPHLPVHVSTQANCLNFAAARVYADMGATRVVLAREMSLDEIAELRAKTPRELELEAFVHGAMCMSYSGRCMLSAYLTGRSANRGACAQSCRWTYHLMEEKRPGQFFPIEEDARGATILSSLDLNCLSFLDQIMAAGVVSFKIEGRMKSPYYVATVVNAYRRRIDAILSGTASPEHTALLERELNAASHRPYSSGFYFGELIHHAPDTGAYLQDCTFVGVVQSQIGDRIAFECRNKVNAGDRIEILSPSSLGESFVAEDIQNANGESEPAAARPNELYSMRCEKNLAPGDILRVRMNG